MDVQQATTVHPLLASVGAVPLSKHRICVTKPTFTVLCCIEKGDQWSRGLRLCWSEIRYVCMSSSGGQAAKKAKEVERLF
jgi:hypothetical protein